MNYIEGNAFDRIQMLTRLRSIAETLSTEKLSTLVTFATQTVDLNDVDAMQTFLRWKDNAVLDTILLLATDLDEDQQYEVLHKAEDLINECRLRSVRCPLY